MVVISKLSLSDIPKVRSFVLEAWRLAGPGAFGWTGATDENIKEIASEDFLRGLVGNPGLKVFISKAGDDVVGFCAMRNIDGRLVELAGIIVRQDELGKGIGSDLFEAARRDAVASGFTAMLVKTESTNDRAMSFYRSKGFAEQEKAVEEVSGTNVKLTILKLNLQEM